MTFQIGPITLQFHEALDWDNKRRLTVTPIPLGKNQGYTAGVDLTSYRIQSSFYAATDAAAKILRRQLHELARNVHIDFVYIDFGLDAREHSGWYLIDSVSTAPLPAVFGDYPVSINVQRLGNTGSHLLGTYWLDKLLTNDWGFTGKKVVTLPDGAGSAGLKERVGDGGQNEYIEDFGSNTVSYPLPALADLYDMRCRILDTVTADSTDTSEWEEVYGPEHIWQGDVIFGNDLIRWRWYSSSNRTGLEVYDQGAADWVEVADDYEVMADSTQFTATYPPILKYFSWDRIEWQLVYSTRTDTTIIINLHLNRGTYFIGLEIKTGKDGLDSDTGLTCSGATVITQVETSAGNAGPAVGLAIDSNSNYAAALLDSGHYIGFLYTVQGTGQPEAGTTTKIHQSLTVAANGSVKVAIFAAESPLVGTLKLGNLGMEYLGNVMQWLVLVEPDHAVVLSEANAVDNILMETGDNILTESGDFILLE